MRPDADLDVRILADAVGVADGPLQLLVERPKVFPARRRQQR
jgi:hypothetical protein